jgi:hypothetical protein
VLNARFDELLRLVTPDNEMLDTIPNITNARGIITTALIYISVWLDDMIATRAFRLPPIIFTIIVIIPSQ